MHTRRGFTLTEVIVTVSLIALLATITVVALRPIRATSKRTDSMNALRQMVLAYNAYAADNNGNLMPGYVSPDGLDLLGLNPELASGKSLDPGLAHDGAGAMRPESDASAYVWRLAPYLDHAWKTLYIDYGSSQVVDRLTTEITRSVPTPPAYGPGSLQPGDLGAARAPSFGMNSIFVGGDDWHGGSAITSRNPWNPTQGVEPLAATRLSQAKSPSRLIVFAPSRYPHQEQDAIFPDAWSRDRLIIGSPEVRPPYINLQKNGGLDEWLWTGAQWRVKGEADLDNEVDVGDVTRQGLSGVTYMNGGGWPTVRWGDQIPVGRLDGSVSSFAIERLSFDMRMWSPFETGDYKVE